MSKNIEAEAAKLAGLQIDLLQKIRNNKISLSEFESFLNSPHLNHNKTFSSKTICPKWREAGGKIYFSVTSNGKTGEEWIKHFEAKKNKITSGAKKLLLSSDFKPTIGITNEVVVLKEGLLSYDNRTIKNIRDEAKKLNLRDPDIEIACLVRDFFIGKELGTMGFESILVMHQPVKDSYEHLRLLSVHYNRCDDYLTAFYGNLDNKLIKGCGFAFVASVAAS